MATLLVNGSPKAKTGNTQVFIRKFVTRMKTPYEICYAAMEDSSHIATYMKEFDAVIVVMPLYIHAMPGIVMKILECMEPSADVGKKLGFIVQSGFMESAQSKYLEMYLSSLAKNLNYTYLGTVIRGGSAGIYMMPEKMNTKLFKQLGMLGEYFDKNGSFDMDIVKKMAKPHDLSKAKCKILQIVSWLGLGDTLFWNMMLKQNNAFDKRFDTPFAKEKSE